MSSRQWYKYLPRLWRAQQRSYSGVTMPSPSKLDQIMQVDLLINKTPEEVSDIWLQYHSDETKNRVGGVLSAQEYNTFAERAKKSPMFVLPLGKPGGGFLTLVSQCQVPFVLFTMLEDFKRHGDGAAPHLTLTHYTELIDSHKVVLVRGDVISDKVINVKEANMLLQLTRAFYTSDEDYKMVYNFNHNPIQFDFNALLRLLKLDDVGTFPA